jgi:transposase
MGLIAMSERDLQRIEVLSKVVERHMTIVAAAHVLALSPRQVRRLLERLQTDGAAAIRHKARGRPSNNRISGSVRDYALAIVRERNAGFGATLAAEKLAERQQAVGRRAGLYLRSGRTNCHLRRSNPTARRPAMNHGVPHRSAGLA